MHTRVAVYKFRPGGADIVIERAEHADPAACFVQDSGPPGRYVAVPVRGDCMEPRVHAGDHAVVDREAAAVGDVCAIFDAKGWALKRLREAQDGRLTFGADNPAYPALIHVRREEGCIQAVVIGIVTVGEKP